MKNIWILRILSGHANNPDFLKIFKLRFSKLLFKTYFEQFIFTAKLHVSFFFPLTNSNQFFNLKY